ncbi:MAG: ATP-binding cassette domain-containing protein [Proteobacteria bacterium]|nr:ATP-binding cassette domain-containing protein [Pseudomonadota bacterium]
MGSLKLKGIRKSFGKFEAIKGVDLDIADGEFVVFVGPSGCGKSTLLRVIAGLEEHSDGNVEIDGRIVDALPPAKRGIAMVFQTYALYPHLSARGNMELALKQEGVARAEIDTRVTEASRMLALDQLLDRRPAELSGGQRQRIAIGRAVVREPSLFLFDEPLSNLDAGLRVNTRLEIARLHRLLKATIVYVTHDQVEAMTLADRIVVLNQGVIEQVGAPLELYRRPANLFVAGFIGSPKMNFVQGAAAAAHGAHTLGIRPEHLRLVQSGGIWQGEVSHVEHLGSDTFVYVDVPETGTLTLRLDGEAEAVPGANVSLSPVVNQLHRFGSNGQRLAD